MKKYLIGAGALLALAGVVAAQPLVQQSLSGNEVVVVEAGGPGGTGFFTSVAALRGGNSYTLVATGATVNQTVPNNSAKIIITGAITTLNLTMPTTPYDGQTVAINCPGGTITTVAVTYTPGTLVGTAYTTCTAGGTAAQGAEWTYSLANTTWYRVM